MHLYLEDTICAPATSTAGAVAMIRVSGADSLSIVDKLVEFKRGTACDSKGYSLKFGSVKGLDDVVVAIYRNPNSYTGEDSAEISCHASPYIVSSLLSLLIDAGCRLAEPGEFTRRAFVNGKMDLAQAEAVADVISSTSSAQHRIAFNQLRGGYSAELALVRGQLLELASLLELELDFSEEDLEFADRGRLASLLDSAIGKCQGLADSFRLGNAIKNGVPVAIVGSPNSGKSTLLNALLEDDRAIVSSIAGTTRDTIEETCTIGGVLFRFIDTAGIRESSDTIEKLGIERSFAKASSAEIVLGLVDANSDVEAEIAALRAMDISGKLLIVINKIDECAGAGEIFGVGSRCCEGAIAIRKRSCKPSAEPDLFELCQGVAEGNDEVVISPSITSELPSGHRCSNTSESLCGKIQPEDILWISAKTGQGLNDLRSALVSQVGNVSEDAILVTNARHAAALRSAAESLEVVRRGLGVGTGGRADQGTGVGSGVGVGLGADVGVGSGSGIGSGADVGFGSGVGVGLGADVGFGSGVGVPADLLAEDLREAIRILGTITGEITTDEVLGNIFKNFCIGK